MTKRQQIFNSSVESSFPSLSPSGQLNFRVDIGRRDGLGAQLTATMTVGSTDELWFTSCSSVEDLSFSPTVECR